jgi:hypothetical protein
MIASTPNNQAVDVVYRPAENAPPMHMQSSPDLAQFISRLGGANEAGVDAMHFSYSEILAVLQALSDQKKLSAIASNMKVPAQFMLQDVAGIEATVYNAPAITDATDASALPNLDPNKTLDTRAPTPGNRTRPQ